MPQTWKQKKPAGWIIWCKSSVFIEPWNAATTTAGSGRAVRNHRPPEIAVFFFLLLFYFFSFNWFIPQQANIASAALITCRRLRAEVFFFFFKFNIRSSLTNIGGSNRSPDQLLLSPTTPTPPPSLSFLLTRFPLSFFSCKKMLCSWAAPQWMNWCTVSDHHLSAGFSFAPGFQSRTYEFS